MERQCTLPDSRRFLAVFSVTFLLVTVLPVLTSAQISATQLPAYKQLLPDSKHGNWTLKTGPADNVYVLNRSVPTSAIWVTDYSGVSQRMIVSTAEYPELRAPRDLAVDRDGNVIVVNGDGLIMIFSEEGKLVSSFQAERSVTVAVLSDGRIVVSGFPKDHLISIYSREGQLLEGLGEPVKVETKDAFNRRIMNMGSIVVDDEDNIYFVFRNLLAPIVRKYTMDGKLVAEWRVESPDLNWLATRAAKQFQKNEQDGGHGVVPVITSAAFDNDTKSLWLGSAQHVFQLDSSGHIIRNLSLASAEGQPVQVLGLAVNSNFICAAGPLHGTFEFLKPR
jgi:hypothetical protein